MAAPKYPLQDLVMVRKLRETAALQAVSAARAQLQAAKESVVQAKQTLADYQIWRVDEEKRSFEKILHKEVSLEKLEVQKQEVRALREKESEHEQAILDAEKRVAECETLLAERIAAQREAEADLRKLEEHREIWNGEQALIFERKEEDEMDDFRAPARLSFGN